MRLRNILDIFPPDYENVPDEADLRRECRAWMEEQLPPDAIARRIDQEECPYTREAKVTAFFVELEAFAEENSWSMPTFLREQLEDRLRPIVRIAHGEQVQLETTSLNRDLQAPVAEKQLAEAQRRAEKRIDRLEQGLQRMQEDLDEMREERQNQPLLEDLFHYISPRITSDIERLHIHKEIQNIVVNYPLPEVCRYLKQMETEGRVYLSRIKPDLAFDELHRMGLPDESTSGFTYKNFTKYYNTND